MQKIYLIRHAQASFEGPDYDQLSALGMHQAAILGESLAGRLKGVTHCYSGTLQRQRQTLAHTLSALSSPPDCVTDGDWNEFDHRSLLAGLRPEFANPAMFRKHLTEHDDPENSFRELFQQATLKWIQQDHEHYPESWNAFKTRVRNALARLVVENPEPATLVVFTSGGPIAAIVQDILQLRDDQFAAINQTLINCGITKLLNSRHGLILSTFNEHGFLEGRSVRAKLPNAATTPANNPVTLLTYK